MANPPLLTPEQRQKALEKAAAARRQRAEVKDKLKIGSLSLEELFEQADNTDETGDMLKKLKVVSVLESLPGVGKVNAKRLLKGLEISETRRLGGVGDKQRERLLKVVDNADYRKEILAGAAEGRRVRRAFSTRERTRKRRGGFGAAGCCSSLPARPARARERSESCFGRVIRISGGRCRGRPGPAATTSARASTTTMSIARSSRRCATRTGSSSGSRCTAI